MIDIPTILNTIMTNKKVLAIFSVLETIVILFLLLFSKKNGNIYHSKTIKLTDKITVPMPVGEGQYGTSWWLNKKEYDKVFKYHIINRNKDYKEICFSSGGVIVNFERKNEQEKIYYIDDNLHVLLIGSSRISEKVGQF